MMVETNIIKWFKEAWKENSGEEYTQPLGGLPFCSNDNWGGHVVMEFALFIEKKAHQQGREEERKNIFEVFISMKRDIHSKPCCYCKTNKHIQAPMSRITRVPTCWPCLVIEKLKSGSEKEGEKKNEN